MKLYVWQCSETLLNYGSGLVVVAAESLGMAWAKLRAEAPPIWMKLTHGNTQGWAETEDEIAWALAQEDFETDEGFPLQPDIYEIGKLPVLYRTGSS